MGNGMRKPKLNGLCLCDGCQRRVVVDYRVLQALNSGSIEMPLT